MSRALPQSISTKLAQLRRSVSLWLWTVGLSRLVVGAVLLALASLGIDRYFRMDRAQRAVSLALAIAALAFLAWRQLLRAVRRPLADEELSWDLEQRHPELGESLISAVEFSRSGASGCSAALMDLAIDQGARRMGAVEVDDVLDRSRRNLNLAAGALAALVLLGMCIALGPTMSLWARRNLLLQNIPWPQKTYLVISNQQGEELRVPRGDDLELRVRADGIVPSLVTVDFSSRSAGSGSEQMVRVGDNSFRWVFRNVLEPMRVRVWGGDAVNEWVPVRLVERPAARQLGFTVQPPAYTKLAEQHLALGEGSYYVLRGSTLWASGAANKPLGKVEVWRGKDRVSAKTSVQGVNFGIELPPNQLQGGAYSIQLTDTEGLGSRPPARFTLRVTEDAKPAVRAKLDGIGEMITPRVTIPMTLRITDDYGLTAAGLVYHDPAAGPVENGDPPVKRIAFSGLAGVPGAKELSHAWRFEAAPLQLPTDSHLTFFIEARDNDTLGGPKAGASATFSLRVVADEVLRNELLRREQEQRQEFERVLEQQKGLLAESEAIRTTAATQPAWPQAEHRRMKDSEKRQRLLGQRCDAIAMQFSQILAEVENNKLEEGEGPVRKRLQEGIIAPLRSLAATLIPQAAGYLDQAATASVSPAARLESLARAQALQDQIVARMKDVLRNMVKWEGYQEAVLLMREVLKDQKDINEATIKAEQERIKRLFGEDAPATQPKK